MTLRIPDFSKEEGVVIAHEALGQVFSGLSGISDDKQIDSIDLKLMTSPGTTKTELARLIGKAILGKLI